MYDANALAMFFGLGVAIGLMVGLWVVFRRLDRCTYCGRLHAQRYPNMTAFEFMRLFCQKELPWRPR